MKILKIKQLFKKMAANSSTNHSSVKLNLKLEMWPVNALRLEWCYDIGNDKNITIIRLSMQLI